MKYTKEEVAVVVVAAITIIAFAFWVAMVIGVVPR
jgi:hypothetical protein